MKQLKKLLAAALSVLLLAGTMLPAMAEEAAGGGDVLLSAGFEDNTGDWVNFDDTAIEVVSDPVHGGTAAMKFDKAKNGVKYAPGIEVEAGTLYHVSVWVNGQAYLKSAVSHSDFTVEYWDLAAGGEAGTWTLLEADVDIPNGSDVIKMDITFQTDDESVYIDDITFTKIGASESVAETEGDDPLAGVERGENLFPDPGFESVTEDWLLLTETPPEYTTEVVHEGSQAMSIPNGNGIKLMQRIDVITGVTYEITAWVYGKVQLIGMMYDNADNPIDYYNAASPFMGGGEEGKWTQITGTFMTDDERVGNVSIEFRAVSPDTYLDDISFRSCGVIEDTWEPTPSDEPVKLGCYYFSNWVTPESWSLIKDFAEVDIEPVIGYYQDGLPEVQEWHIKQATQHGISFWVFDWYYDMATNTVLGNNAALDNGFLNASNCEDMEFAIMWCNEEEDISCYTEETMLAMTQTICERYLSKGNYLKTPDGRNYFAITRPDRLIDLFGVQGTKSILMKMNEAAAEYGGFYYVAIKYPTEADMTQLKGCGFDATTLYSYSSDGMPQGAQEAPYEKILPAVEPIIRAGDKADILPIIPCASPGWDSRPWIGIGDRGSWRSGSTPELFAEMCTTLRQYADPELNMMMIGTWNEFGEGSHIEPTTLNGCSYLDAMQQALLPDTYEEHELLVPTDEEKARMDFTDIPSGTPELEDDGNLVVNPSFERGYGWTSMGAGALEYSDDCKDGERSLILTPELKGVKSANLITIEPETAYDVSIWVKGDADLVCALYDEDGVWTNEYIEFDEKAQSRGNSDWVKLTGRLENLPEHVKFVDVEVVNVSEDGSNILVDLAEVRVVEPVNVGMIVLISAGAVVVVAAVVVAAVLLARKSAKAKKSAE